MVKTTEDFRAFVESWEKSSPVPSTKSQRRQNLPDFYCEDRQLPIKRGKSCLSETNGWFPRSLMGWLRPHHPRRWPAVLAEKVLVYQHKSQCQEANPIPSDRDLTLGNIRKTQLSTQLWNAHVQDPELLYHVEEAWKSHRCRENAGKQWGGWNEEVLCDRRKQKVEEWKIMAGKKSVLVQTTARSGRWLVRARKCHLPSAPSSSLIVVTPGTVIRCISIKGNYGGL